MAPASAADGARDAPERLVLASGSPRRSDLLAALGLEFTVRPAGIDESLRPDEAPDAYVERLAREKASARCHEGELVIAADTAVVLENAADRGEPALVLGKPENEQDARRMLRLLRGRWHTVLTGVALLRAGERAPTSAVATSKVALAPMDEDEVEWYVATGEPDDKAGGYAIQGIGALFVQEVRGNYSNVVGLPLPLLYALARRVGCDLRSYRS